MSKSIICLLLYGIMVGLIAVLYCKVAYDSGTIAAVRQQLTEERTDNDNLRFQYTQCKSLLIGNK